MQEILGRLLSNGLAFLVLVGVLVFVHELGHFIVGRIFGVRVLVFSLGFGKRIWGFRRGDTDYRVALIPLGGYVLFAGQDPGQEEQRPDDFLAQPRWQRILIYLAGPAMNVVLAIVLIAVVFMAGTNIINPRDLPADVGYVLDDSAAAEAGLETGDRIVAIDGDPMQDWLEVSMLALTSPGRDLVVTYERDGVEYDTVLRPRVMARYELGDPGFLPSIQTRVAGVFEGRPAAEAGLEYGDAILAVDGHAVASPANFSDLIAPRVGETVQVEIERDGERRSVEIVPEMIDGRAAIGIYIAQFEFRRFGFVEAVQESVRHNVDTVVQIGLFMQRIFERRISAKSAIGGPLEIARESGAAARQGWRDLFFLMALISINLFLVNMLPVPILDGGQILILTVETTLRRDLSLAVKERLIQVGLVVIVSLMAMALYFDLLRSLPGSSEPVAEAPAETGEPTETEPEVAPSQPEGPEP